MTNNLRIYSVTSLFGLLLMQVGCTSTYKAPQTAPKHSASHSLKVTSWNVEHLAYPIDSGCKPRTPQELSALQSYAQQLDADIVGLQEVASRQAVMQLFPETEWQIVMSQRPDSETYDCRGSERTSTQQKVAFAIRKSIPIKMSNTLDEFALGNPGLRHGLVIEVETPIDTVSILNLHLKSGCYADNYSRTDSDACKVLAQQVPVLQNWVAKQEQTASPYLILGDFNHRLSAPYNHFTQKLLSTDKGQSTSILNTGAQLIGCHPYYPAPIDHILAGNMHESKWQFDTAFAHFDNMKVDAMLSDHCALTTEISRKKVAVNDLSAAVYWLQHSKEYQAIAKNTYQLATNALTHASQTNEPWVVVMDVDETILDNSPYQVMLNETDQQYTEPTWDTWVQSEQARLTPGAAAFVNAVFKQGGKLALITNRKAKWDKHTWQNLRKLGLPIDVNNTCLIGRSEPDIQAVGQTNIINDKDLRRQQVSQGNANCYAPENNSQHWQGRHQIVMQIGDNIEDFSQITQESANVDAWLHLSNTQFFLLPNPMYGSW